VPTSSNIAALGLQRFYGLFVFPIEAQALSAINPLSLLALGVRLIDRFPTSGKDRATVLGR
jgi:hypothetical protein